jgi:hypothetical protein
VRNWLLHLVSSAHLLALCSTFSKVWFSERLVSIWSHQDLLVLCCMFSEICW